jgi:hypothetical protein
MQAVSRRFLSGWLLGVGAGLVLAATSVATEPGAAPAVGAAPPATLTVIGKVKLETSEADGSRVIQIVDAERRALIVDEVGAGRVLVKHEGERVSATGVVSLRRDGREVLEVSSFRPLGE